MEERRPLIIAYVRWLQRQTTPQQPSCLRPSPINGKLSSGVLTDTDVVIGSDEAYLNVHTGENSAGEVRGQITVVETLAGGF